jgi:hypothetical protein
MREGGGIGGGGGGGGDDREEEEEEEEEEEKKEEELGLADFKVLVRKIVPRSEISSAQLDQVSG